MTNHSTHSDLDLEIYQFAGGLMTILADGASTGGHYSLLLADIPPENITPPHFHDIDTETLVVLDGVMTAETPGQLKILGAGDLAMLTPGQVHRLSNSGEADASYLLLCAPAGFEGFVRRVGLRVNAEAAAPKQMDEEDVRRMVEAAPGYGVRLTDETGLPRPASYIVAADRRESFVAFGATVEVLARCDDDGDVVLIRAVAIRPAHQLSALPTSSLASEGTFFAGGADGSRHGTFASASGPVLLAVTNRNVLQLLREDSMSELMVADGGPLGRLLLVLTALHATRGSVGTPLSPSASSVRRGFPIH